MRARSYLVAVGGCVVLFPNQSWQGSVEATFCEPGQLSFKLLTVKVARFLLEEVGQRYFLVKKREVLV